MAPSFTNQRPGYPISPPAAARHLVFRLRMDENPRWTTPGPVRERKWQALCGRLDRHLEDLRDRYGNSDPVEFCPPHVSGDPAKGRFSIGASCLVPVVCRDSKFRYRLRVRVDVHTELLSLTYIFDDIADESVLGKLITALPGDRPGRRPASDGLFDGIWSDTDRLEVPAAAALRSWLDDGMAKMLITDFRSIVICPESEWPMGEPSLEISPARNLRIRVLNKPLKDFASAHSGLIRAVADPYELDRKARDATDPASEACAEGGEPVVCGMLDGTALYAAALGEWGRHVTKPQPIRHLLVYAGHSYSQLGRLVRRMHVLGELRHAAVIDYDTDQDEPGRKSGLREASRTIRIVGGELTRDTPKITSAIRREAGRKGRQRGASTDRLQGFVNKLAKISGMVDGGLTHRIEQSRYYAQEFERSVEHLRMVRVDGWQPYNDFVERYVLHLFARIDRIGNRYEALGRRLDRLLFYQQARLMDSYTDTVQTTVGEIALSTQAINRNADVQTGLLTTAEAFAVVFLCYYVGSVLHHWFEEGNCIGPIDKALFVDIWTVVTIAAGSWLTLRLIQHARRRLREWRKRRLARRASHDRAKDRSKASGHAEPPRRRRGRGTA